LGQSLYFIPISIIFQILVTEFPFSELLGQLAAIAESLPGAEGQLARACYKLSIIYMDMQREDESQRFRQRALEVRAKLRPQDQHEPAFEESQFSMLNLFMLW
jgi:hypothetical protein